MNLFFSVAMLSSNIKWKCSSVGWLYQWFYGIGVWFMFLKETTQQSITLAAHTCNVTHQPPTINYVNYSCTVKVGRIICCNCEENILHTSSCILYDTSEWGSYSPEFTVWLMYEFASLNLNYHYLHPWMINGALLLFFVPFPTARLSLYIVMCSWESSTYTQRQLFPPWHVSSTACSIQNMWKGIYDDDDDYIDKSLYIYWINCQKQEACDDRKPKRVWHWFFWTALLALLSKARLLCIHPPLLTIYFLFRSLFSPLLTNYNSTASSRSLPVISTHTQALYYYFLSKLSSSNFLYPKFQPQIQYVKFWARRKLSSDQWILFLPEKCNMAIT